MSWIAVALADDIAPGSAAPVVVDGVEFVVWRSAAGRIAVWIDRCPHRGMRLSFGFVRGETISCLYHGWQFSVAGSCTRIPAHPELEPPATITADLRTGAEAGGLVFVWTDPATVPEDLPAAPPEPVHGVLSLAIERPRDDVASALGLAADGPPVARIRLGDRPALVALQPKTAGTTVLHLLATRLEDRPALADAAERLRRRLEAAAPAGLPEGADA